MLEYVLLDILQEIDHLRQFLVAFLQFLDVVADRIDGEFAVQALEFFLGAFAPLRELAQQFLQLLVEMGDIFLDRALFGFVKLLELVGTESFVILVHRRESIAGGRLHQADVLLLGLLAQVFDGVVFAQLGLLLDFLGTGAVFLAFKGGRDGDGEFLD